MAEKRASELAVGDVLIGKAPPHRRLTIAKMMPGLGGEPSPYLTMTDDAGNEVEHDTSFDSYGATYTVATMTTASDTPTLDRDEEPQDVKGDGDAAKGEG